MEIHSTYPSDSIPARSMEHWYLTLIPRIKNQLLRSIPTKEYQRTFMGQELGY